MFETVVEMIATAAFSITGVLAATEKKVDVFGVLVLGIVTAVGGGTMRDVLLDVPVFWVEDFLYVWVAAFAALATFALRGAFTRAFRVLLYLDGFGAALFGIAGMAKGMALGHPAAVAAVFGVLTAIGGGLVRDVVSGRPTLLMSRELYATPVLMGCGLYGLAVVAGLGEALAGGLCIAIIFALRTAAIRFELHMPDALVMQTKGRLS